MIAPQSTHNSQFVNWLKTRGEMLQVGGCANDAITANRIAPFVDLQNCLNDVVNEAILKVYERRDTISGYRIISAPAYLQHFTARFEPIDELAVMSTLRSNHGRELLLHN